MSEPVRIGDAELWLGDCLEILPMLGKVDSVVTDPPYGIRQDKGFGGFGGFGPPIARRQYDGEWDQRRPEESLIRIIIECADVHIIWGAQFFCNILPVSGKWLWWDKLQTMPSFGDGELAWTSLPGNGPRKIVYSNNGLMAKEKNRQHPTQKPVQVMQWCVQMTSGTVFDPFMGSGTTGVACAKLGRKFIGVEIEEKYFQIACRRIEEAYRQPDMFIERPAPAVQKALL